MCIRDRFENRASFFRSFEVDGDIEKLFEEDAQLASLFLEDSADANFKSAV